MEVIIVELSLYDHIATGIQRHMLSLTEVSNLSDNSTTITVTRCNITTNISNSYTLEIILVSNMYTCFCITVCWLDVANWF